MSELRDEVYCLAVEEVVNGDSPEHTAQEIAYALADFIRNNVHQGKSALSWVQSLTKLALELGSVIPRKEV